MAVRFSQHGHAWSRTPIGGRVFFSRRRKFNGNVVRLFPAFEFSLENAGGIQTLHALDIAWKKGFNEYEAAYYIAILMLSGLAEAEEFKRAQAAHERLMLVSASWLRDGLISEPFVSGLQPMVDEIIRSMPSPSPKHHLD